MKSSDFIHRVTIQDKLTVQDSVGAETSFWSDAFRLWCAIVHEFRPTDDFAEIANAQFYESKTWFVSHKTRRVQMTHRVKFEDKQYEILEIQDQLGRNRETRILARLVQL